jgi:hypothetical protein
VWISPRLPAAAAAALCVLLLAACSFPRLVYNQADWLLLREMDSYLDLRDEQREQAAAVLALHLEQHRREQLPEFARTFREAALRVRRRLDEQDAQWFMDRGVALLEASGRDLLSPLARTLTDLDAEQRARLRERLQERNGDFRDRHALDRPWDERLDRAVVRTVDRIEFWTGPLSEEQVALVRDLRAAMPDTAPRWLAYTRAQQERLLAMLDAGAQAAQVERFLDDWWLRQADMPPALEAMRGWHLDSLLGMMVRISASLDSVQREHLVDRLESFAEDATSLATEA